MGQMHFPARELLWGWQHLAPHYCGSLGLPSILSGCQHTQLVAESSFCCDSFLCFHPEWINTP